MNWTLFALLSGSFYTIQSLLTRYLLRGDRDAWAFSFYFSFVGALTSLPFLLFDPSFSYKISAWLILGLVGLLIVLQNYLAFKSTNYLEASVQGSINKFRLLWVLLIGVAFLGESLSLIKVVGTALTIFAGLIIYFKKTKVESQKGFAFALSATFFYAIVIGLYKILFQEFNSPTLTFFIFAIPAICNVLFMPNAIKRITLMAKQQGKEVFVATFFGGLANLAMNHALSIGEASKVLVIIEAFLLIVLVGEHFLLKEKEDMLKKVISVVLATIGAILIRLAN